MTAAENKIPEVNNLAAKTALTIVENKIPHISNLATKTVLTTVEDLDIASYADDINTLEASSLPLFTWFNNDFMKGNSDKSHILLSCGEPSTELIDGSSTESNAKEILLGITIDRDLKFDEHVNNICKKSYQKLNALVRLAPFMNIDEKE